jgi:RNA binding exosome subunit
VEIRVFSHATEDLEKVQTAVRNILPEPLTEELAFSKAALTGHHGNPITCLK